LKPACVCGCRRARLRPAAGCLPLAGLAAKLAVRLIDWQAICARFGARPGAWSGLGLRGGS